MTGPSPRPTREQVDADLERVADPYVCTDELHDRLAAALRAGATEAEVLLANARDEAGAELAVPTSDEKILTDPIILMCAFRYALGSATYIVGWVADELIAHRDALRPQWRQQTVRDIREATGDKRAGMDMDARRWQQVVDAFLAVPTACQGCGLTADVCASFPPLCCPDCRHDTSEAS